ncbi:MAG: DUF5686 family protein [Gillisia sp.]
MKKILPFIIVLAAFFSSYAQTRISGIVQDEAGTPVPFANVVFLNSSEGTTTNQEGKFYLTSGKVRDSAEFSYVGYETLIIPLKIGDNLNMKVVLTEASERLSEVTINQGKTSKTNNPALDILRKIWANKRENGVNKFAQYQFRKYEKLEFDLNSIDSSVIKNPIFNGMEFIFDNLDTNKVTGKASLPIFINESALKVYGDNKTGKKRVDLLGNKNSGFNENQNLIALIKDVYDEYDIYDNYLQFFDKTFISPLSTTGINNYSYVLKDSAYIGNKWCYNIQYYPRRKNELTFKGDFWVNDTTWAIREINLEMTEGANLNWITGVYIEQEFDVVNDSVFLITRDFFQANFSFQEKEGSRGISGKKTILYGDYEFDIKKPSEFFRREVKEFQKEVYTRDDDFWIENRVEPLSRRERAVYKMIDTLQTVKAFKRLYKIATFSESGFVKFKGWDFGPVYSLFGYNAVEGFRVRLGGRTYFGQNDPWRIQGYTAYGFRDQKIKYGILGSWLLDKKSRLIVSAGTRRDVEQLGAGLTNSTDVLGRSLASSSLLNVGANDKLSSINLSVVSVEMEPLQNFTVRVSGSFRNLKPASPGFSLEYYTDESRNKTATEINQMEISTIINYSPGRKTSGYGVERIVVNGGDFPTFFLSYRLGVKDVLNSDFDYKRLQFFYDQPIFVGGFGKSNVSLEAGKTFGAVPLGLLSVVPGNQTYFALYNSFSLLNFYEFVTDTYLAVHLEHNFNGRLFARIPGLRHLNLREIVGIKGVLGSISEENKNLNASGIPLIAPNDEPYWQYSLGVGNIFKFLRLDAHFRGNYFDIPDARKFGVTATLGFHF